MSLSDPKRMSIGKEAALSIERNEQRGLCQERSDLFASSCCDCRLDLCLHRLKIEARALLHWREVNQGLRSLCDFLLYKSEAPKLVGVPIVECQGSTITRRQSRSLVGVKAQIDKDGPIDLHRGSEPA